MLRQFSIFSALNILTEGKSVNDTFQLWLQANVGFTVTQAGYWATGAGTSGLIAGKLATFLMPKMGYVEVPFLLVHQGLTVSPPILA